MQNNFSICIAKSGHILGAEKRRETEKDDETDALPSVASRRLSRPRGTGPRPPAQRGGVWRPSFSSRQGRHASGFFSRFVMSVPCFGRFQRGEFRVRSRLASSWSFVFDAK